IATGLGRRQEAERIIWSPPVSSQAEMDDLEIPTILRKPTDLPGAAADGGNNNKRPATNLGVVAAKKYIVHPDLQYEENELDTPPFLRKAD
ncbi:MAG: hypothetical protein PHX53_16315, partial [Syntrophales bacterium]|nr:hypothetical protein [Syntrophales bacterium]